VVAAVLFPLTITDGDRSANARANAISTARTMSDAAIDRYEDSGQVEAFGPYKITVPQPWEKTKPDEGLCHWPWPGTPQLITLRANLPSRVCPPLPKTARPTVNDGAILYFPGAEPYDEIAAPGRLLLTLRPGNTALVRVYAIPGQRRHLLVKFRDGAYTYQISVAVGRDGHTAGRVIASILPNPDDA
jgi:hypothetical protein